MLRLLFTAFCISIVASPRAAVIGGEYTFGVHGSQLQLNGQPFKVLGLRCSNALLSEQSTDDLVGHLEEYRSHGINAVSVFLMGSRFGDVKGYRPDGTLNPIYAGRMARIINAADEQGMIVVVGCLYWSTSRAKEDLQHWTQKDANRAIANTVRWLSKNNFRNVFVDVDNEGMAHDATGWSIAEMIDAGHAVDASIMLAYNDGDPPPDNADLYIHHSPKVDGKPWLDTEATPGKSTPRGYWGEFSKQTHKASKGSYYNYSRIGRYTAAMKAEQIRRTQNEVDRYNGHMLASTWLQCVPNESVDGPFTTPGGHSRIEEIDQDIDQLHDDAGIAWWLDFVREQYGPWNPPAVADMKEPSATPRPKAGPFASENLHVWAFEEYDPIERSPDNRAGLLQELKIKRAGYICRNAERVSEFEDYVTAYRRKGIELISVWTPVHTSLPMEEPQIKAMLEIVDRHRLKIQWWLTLEEDFDGLAQQDCIAHAVRRLQPLLREANQRGCKLVLYGHGVNRWFTQCENQIAIVEQLKAIRQEAHVGIVYNFHQSHAQMDRFKEVFPRLEPHLAALNLNGMHAEGPRIETIGQGAFEKELIETVLVSGWHGPVGILHHQRKRDPKETLQANLVGLQSIMQELASH